MGNKMSCVKKDKNNKSTNKVSVEPNEGIYHEKQIKEMCALHALNNLFQDKKAFTKQSLDDLCTRLSPGYFMNPHKSVLGFGNYDVNVIMAAIQTKDCETIWFDKRKDINSLNFEKIFGFILNIPTDYKWGFLRLPIHRKHWISMRKIGAVYYNLDSKLDVPEVIGTALDLQTYLKEQVESKDKELLLVVTNDVDRDESWRRSESQTEKEQEKTTEMYANHHTDANSNRDKGKGENIDGSEQLTDDSFKAVSNTTQVNESREMVGDQSTFNGNEAVYRYV